MPGRVSLQVCRGVGVHWGVDWARDERCMLSQHEAPAGLLKLRRGQHAITNRYCSSCATHPSACTRSSRCP
jgi:hypothetical protein